MLLNLLLPLCKESFEKLCVPVIIYNRIVITSYELPPHFLVTVNLAAM